MALDKCPQFEQIALYRFVLLNKNKNESLLSG